jgi:hypothetical protein
MTENSTKFDDIFRSGILGLFVILLPNTVKKLKIVARIQCVSKKRLIGYKSLSK